MTSGSEAIVFEGVSRETRERLREFAALVVKWTSTVNLIGRASIEDVWARHVVDSGQLYHFAPSDFRTWADLGSGGGFPGIVLAILAKELNDAGLVTMIESDQRKVAFLQTAAAQLDLKVTTISNRAEHTPPQAADVVSARALAPLDKLLGLVSRHLEPGGVAILPKGRRAAEEIIDARALWHFDLETRTSLTDPDAAILLVRNIRPRGVDAS